MNKIKFLNNKNDFFYCFDGIEQPDGTVKLKFKSDFPSDNVLCSGFEIISEDTNENISGDYYHNYTTIYRKISNENAVQLSKNGSVYVEANNNQYMPTLEEVKTFKIHNFSTLCNQEIISGVDIAFTENAIEHFSYTEEDQVNLKEIFDLVIQTNIPMYYHADGGSCKLYTAEQIIEIYMTATKNKLHHIAYFNQMRMYINSLETIEEVKNVYYGQELTGEYLQTYKESMAQAEVVLQSLLNKRAAKLASAEL